MNVIIIILAVIGSLVALFLIIASFTKKECIVEKEILINKSPQEVFNYVRYLKNQEHYSVWVMKDPNINLVYTGTDGTVGSTSAWTSNDKNVGVGAQEIIKMDEGKSIDVELRFEKPFKATNYAHTSIVPATGGTKIINIFSGKSKFPMNFMNLFMSKLLGKDMEKNLVNLKNILEK